MNSDKMFEDYSLYQRQIRDLSPAELMLLTDNKASFSELLRITIMDLFLRNIIDIQKKEKYLEEHKKSISFHLFVQGKRFKNYQPRLHEKALIDFLRKQQSLTLLLIMQKLFPTLRSRRNFYNRHLRAQLVKKQFIVNVFFYKYLDIFQKTRKGKAISFLLNNIRSEVFEHLDDWIRKSPTPVIELIHKLDNHCLTDTYLLKKILFWANSKETKFNTSKLTQKGKSYFGDYIIALNENPASVINLLDIEWHLAIPVYSGYTESNDIHQQVIQYAISSEYRRFT